MGTIVQKFGGSSVADVDRLGLVADKVVATREAGHDVVVVVSAMGKTTDQLLALAKQVDENPPRRELDMLLTTGERVSMALLSMAIQKRGCDAISFTGSQSGIITNDRHFDARIIEVRPHRVEDELARGRVVIIAGYQGMSYKREITTLGRGGSDTTALAMAAALGAERAEIYSDVDGVYSADPRTVAEARHLPEVSYEEMEEMAGAGAKVLHAGAVEFARRAGIAIHARSTFVPGRETVVRDGGGRPGEIRAVVGQRGVVRVEVRGGRAEVAQVLDEAARRSIVPRDLEVSVDRAGFHVVVDHTPDWEAARAELDRAGGDRLTMEGRLGIASVIGDGPAGGHDRVVAAMTALDAAGLRRHRVWCGPLRLSVLVDESDLDESVRVLHATLLGGDTDTDGAAAAGDRGL